MQWLETERLWIRDYAEDGSDLPDILRFTTDPLVATHSSWGPLTKEETLDYLAKSLGFAEVNPRLHYALAVVSKSQNEVIGNVSLHMRSLLNKEAEIGYTLSRDYWGQGYASEAVKALIDYAFAELKIHRIYATTSPENFASQKVLEKLRFEREGYLRKNVLQRGLWRDSILYARLE